MNIKEVIKLVEKYIADPKSVSQEELKVARDIGWVNVGTTAYAVAYTAYAVWGALNGDTATAKYWVAEYHRRTNGEVK